MTDAPLTDAAFAERYGSWALIIGGSDGVGAEFSKSIAARGLNCVLVARRLSVLDELAAELRAAHGVEVKTASIDLEKPDATAAMARAVEGLDIGLVVFNAGAEASGRSFINQPLDAWQSVIRRNVVTMTDALHHFATYFAARKRGGMVVVGSDASLGGTGRASIYTATKGFVLNLAESLWIELKPFNIDVITLIFYLADTPLLRTVLERKGLPIEAINPAKPADLVRAALDNLPNGPTLTWGVDPQSPDSLTSPAKRRERIEYLTAGMAAFYGVEGDEG